jgi:glycosyltransferase involved in cell wall biosynthesis
MGGLSRERQRPLVLVVRMKIYSMMRIRNEARWIARVIHAQLSIVDRILVFDDHSTDNTIEICESFEKATVLRSPFEGLDETRDKNYLIEQVEQIARAGDFILAIDGDEELAPGSCEEILKLVNRPAGPDCYRFQILYLWDRPDQIRVDRWYSDFRRPSLFRLHPGARFSSGHGGGFHCGNVVGAKSVGNCGVELLHWGYMNREDRIRKYYWYNSEDKQPVPAIEDGYKHMVVGDLFPADSRFRWAGPLELRAL